jgi:hypothetical protein
MAHALLTCLCMLVNYYVFLTKIEYVSKLLFVVGFFGPSCLKQTFYFLVFITCSKIIPIHFIPSCFILRFEEYATSIELWVPTTISLMVI